MHLPMNETTSGKEDDFQPIIEGTDYSKQEWNYTNFTITFKDGTKNTMSLITITTLNDGSESSEIWFL